MLHYHDNNENGRGSADGITYIPNVDAGANHVVHKDDDDNVDNVHVDEDDIDDEVDNNHQNGKEVVKDDVSSEGICNDVVDDVDDEDRKKERT